MKTKKTNKWMFKVFFVSMFIANILGVLFFMDRADAKKQVYKKYTKKLTVTIKAGKKKNVNLAKKLKKGDKIKSVKSDDKSMVKVKKISSKKIKLTAGKNVAGAAYITVKTKKKGTIKVKVKVTIKTASTYRDDDDDDDYEENNAIYDAETKITFISKTDKTYFDKVVDEVKSQLADPDKTAKDVYKIRYKDGVSTEYKKADLLERYLESHMTYVTPSILKERGIDVDEYMKVKNAMYPGYSCSMTPGATWEDLYNGTFIGVCQHGAAFGKDLAKNLEFNARCITDDAANHAWLAIEIQDDANIKYWKGISTTSYAPHLYYNAPMTYKSKNDLYELTKTWSTNGIGFAYDEKTMTWNWQ